MARRSHDLLVDEHAVQRQLQRKSGHRRRRLSRHRATAAMRLRPPILKRNYRKPTRLPKS
jgi:hypothetical protein